MNPTRSWTLSSDEFAWLWQQVTDLDAYEYPDPLVIRETPATGEVYAKTVAGLSERYSDGIDADLHVAIRTLADADSRIRCYGRHISGSEVRAVGARAAHIGVVAYQRTRSANDIAPVKLTRTEPGKVPLRISAMLPPTAAGTAGVVRGHTAGVRGQQPPATWSRDRHGRPPAEERIRALMRRHRSAEGQFVIETRLRSGHPSPPRHLSWIDIDRGDFPGRYLVEVDDNDTVVLPVDVEHLARHLESSAPFSGRR